MQGLTMLLIAFVHNCTFFFIWFTWLFACILKFRKGPCNDQANETHGVMLPAEIRMMTQLWHAKFVLVWVHVVCQRYQGYLVSPSFPSHLQCLSKSAQKSVAATSAAAGGGAQAAVEKPEGAEQEQTGSAFPSCLPPGNAMGLIPKTGFVHFWLQRIKCH